MALFALRWAFTLCLVAILALYVEGVIIPAAGGIAGCRVFAMAFKTALYGILACSLVVALETVDGFTMLGMVKRHTGLFGCSFINCHRCRGIRCNSHGDRKGHCYSDRDENYGQFSAH